MLANISNEKLNQIASDFSDSRKLARIASLTAELNSAIADNEPTDYIQYLQDKIDGYKNK